jgi:hypothetical protein
MVVCSHDVEFYTFFLPTSEVEGWIRRLFVFLKSRRKSKLVWFLSYDSLFNFIFQFPVTQQDLSHFVTSSPSKPSKKIVFVTAFLGLAWHHFPCPRILEYCLSEEQNGIEEKQSSQEEVFLSVMLFNRHVFVLLDNICLYSCCHDSLCSDINQNMCDKKTSWAMSWWQWVEQKV